MDQSTLFSNTRFAHTEIAGVDEAGRGCLAGPVVAGACILPSEYDLPGLNDSKKLTAAKREVLYDLIREQAVTWAIGVVWAPEIDRINILEATYVAMGKAVRALKTTPSFLQIDGNKTIPSYALKLEIPQEWIIQGDGKIPAISAASIMAKTFRDRLMLKLSKRYPGYGISKHMGYGTKEHMAAIKKLSPCPQHRMTFRGVKPEKKQQRQGNLF
jgi:ribonuclease HII